MGRGATVACGAELGRGTAARRSTRARLGDADCSRSPARTADTGGRCTGGARNARVAQWLRCGESGGQVGPQGRLPPSPMGMGRQTGP